MVQASYSDVVTQLNSCSLRQSLQLISLLSSVELEGGSGSPFSSIFHSETARLLAEAIIKSKAAWYKDRPITLNDIPRLVNGANKELDDERLQEITSGGERQEMLYKLQRYLSRLAYIQLRPQQAPFVSLGRTLAILEVIPGQFSDSLAPSLQQAVSAFRVQVEKAFGQRVSDLVRTHLALAEYFGRLGAYHLQALPLPIEGRRFSSTQQAKILGRLVNMAANSLHFFRLTERGFAEIEGDELGPLLRGYAAIFSQPISVHRELLDTKDYQVGLESHRLSPLDRFPLIAEEDGNSWYAPNVRCLFRSAPEVIHFTLNERCREVYQSVRGQLLEIYLTLMLQQRVPHLKVIPEKRWHTRRGDVCGPDLLIVDHSEDDPGVVAVEIKSRRMLAGTRFELFDEQIVLNYSDLWSAIKQMPSKITKVFGLSGDYRAFGEDLVRAKEYPIFYLGVAGEAPFLFGELVEYKRECDPEFPLYGFASTYATMSVDTFERMIEVSVQKHRPLMAILREYLEDCRDLELSSPMAESFRHVELDEEKFFGFSFLEPLWPNNNSGHP